MEQYLIPAADGASEYIEKKSRFLGLVVHVTTEAEARARLEAVRKRDYDARHHCWCYILHSGQKRYSDDGEPQGTAGQPMLNVLEREGVQDALCVVTRYFGGILLGAGGLCRAYTKAAKDALDAAGICELRPWSVLAFGCPYALFERVKLELSARGGLVEQTDYGAGEENDFSLATYAVYGETRFLFPGDAEDARQTELLRAGDIACDVLKVPYHGRAVEASTAFLTACSPKLAFIPDSDDEPADTLVVQVLEALGTEVHSGREGDLVVVSDGKEVFVGR